MRLILHAGTHKTGTTSIQAALAAGRRWLGTRAICYPKLDQQRGDAHNRLAHRIAMANEADLDGLRTEFRRSIDKSQTVLVSAEEFSARITGTRYWDGFTDPDFPARKQAYIERLREVFSDFDEVTVHICFRHPDEYAESLYSTMILSRRFRGSFKSFRSAVAPLFYYSRQVEFFRSVFRDVRVTSFDSLLPDLLPSFCNWIGIPVPPVSTSIRRMTPDARLIAWLFQKQELEPDQVALQRLRAKFAGSEAPRNILADYGRTTLWESPESRVAFLQEVDPERQNPGGKIEFTRVHASLGAEELAAIDAFFSAWCLSFEEHRRRPASLLRRLLNGKLLGSTRPSAER